jgi:2',3'-cyclic-nucleotide 2'-phosphodiesterase (5'-nucleotidase family)
MKLISMLFCLVVASPSFAEVFEIHHTNDLHSHFENSPHKPDTGGYARLKAMMDEHKALAKQKGIGAISMDAGDFMEGSIFYLADKGKKSFEAFDRLGHDVAILGNHDYLMAPTDLEAIFRDAPPKRPLLAANFSIHKSYEHINKNVKPVWEGMVGGIKVGVIGITTNDLLYKWRLEGDGKIVSETKVAKKWAKYLRSRGAEVIIALTHIGVNKDKKLAKNVPEIDIVVGGHSHTALQEVLWQKTANNKMVPIVQAGNHGEWLGKLTLDYNRETKSLKVLDYKLIPVTLPVLDRDMADLVEDANRDLNREYGETWLNEVVGHSTLRPFDIKNDDKVWQYFLNDAMMEASNADFAIHTPALSGHNYPVGPVTRRSLYEGNPRTFDFADKYGYNIHTAKIMGGWIKMLAAVCMKLNIPLYFAGVEFKYTRNANGKLQIWNVTHNGKPIHTFKYYRVAFSEGIVRGAYGISKLTSFLVHEGKDKEIPMWLALEDKFRREGIITPEYLNGNLKRNPAAKKVERMVVEPSAD